MTKPVLRIRARKPKTRTGCRTCRMRRIKCDEKRPICLKCSMTGRACDGYEVVAIPFREPAAGNQNRALVPLHRQGNGFLLASITTSPRLGGAESQSFDFFRKRTVYEVTGCFESGLWERLLLQITQREPAIMHAAIAVGSMHLTYKDRKMSYPVPDQDDANHKFALQQYVKAMGHLRTRLSAVIDRSSAEVALISCLLFVALEMLQGQQASALTHLKTGLRIILDLSPPSLAQPNSSLNKKAVPFKTQPVSLFDHLTNTFVRLDLDCATFGMDQSSFLVVVQPHSAPSPSHRKLTFSSLSEAKRYLDFFSSPTLSLIGELIRCGDTDNPNEETDWARALCRRHGASKLVDLSRYPALSARKAKILEDIQAWSSAFASFLTSHSKTFSEQDRRAAMMLKIMQFFINSPIAIMVVQETHEMIYDQFIELYEEILGLGSSYLEYTAALRTAHGPLFTLESGVLSSLYLIGLKCRKSSIRRKAIDLITSAPCQEGLWTGGLFSRFLREVANVEEAGARSRYQGVAEDINIEAVDVLEEERFSSVVLALTGDPKIARLVCGRFLHESTGELEIVEHFFQL